MSCRLGVDIEPVGPCQNLHRASGLEWGCMKHKAYNSGILPCLRHWWVFQWFSFFLIHSHGKHSQGFEFVAARMCEGRGFLLTIVSCTTNMYWVYMVFHGFPLVPRCKDLAALFARTSAECKPHKSHK